MAALDDDRQQLTLEELARQAEIARQAERYVPASNAVAPMIPTPPPPDPSFEFRNRMPPYAVGGALGGSATTQDIISQHEAEGQERGPSYYERGRTLPSDPLPVSEPVVAAPPPPRDLEGQRARAFAEEQPSTLSALGGLIKRGAQAVSDSIARTEGGEAPSTTVSSSTAPAVAAGAAPSGELKPGGALTPTPLPAAEVKPETEAPIRPKGGGGTRTAMQERRHEEFPDATEKAQIDPRYLVRLEQSHPQLHDSIVRAATAAGIGSWDLANMVYAMSKGDPNFRDKDGRTGLTGLTQEDVTRYQQQFPDLFRDAQGNPVTATDPATNLVLGAKKYREMMDTYGSRTPSAILANYLGPGRVNELARLNDPRQQREMIPEAAMTYAREAIGGPNAKAGTQTAMSLTDAGTLTGQQVVQAATAAARSGDMRPFLRTVAQGVPQGMNSTDSWKHIEALAVGAMMARGNYEGAKRASELMFQMSHASTNQALMDADRFLRAGDLVAAAHSMALSYYSAPDGGFAKFHVAGNQLVGQRYNEATGNKVGTPFPVTPATIQSMLNITKDPQEYGKSLRESQKLQADIEKTHAETRHKIAETEQKIPADVAKTKAETKYYEARPELERYRSDNAAEVKLLDIQRKLMANPADAKELEVLRKHLDSEVPRFFPEKDPYTGAPIEQTPEITNQRQLWNNMLMTNRNLEMGRAAEIAKGLTGGKLFVQQHPSGGGVVYNKPIDQGGAPIGVLLTPSAMAILARRSAPPPAAPPPPRIGAPAR